MNRVLYFPKSMFIPARLKQIFNKLNGNSVLQHESTKINYRVGCETNFHGIATLSK